MLYSCENSKKLCKIDRKNSNIVIIFMRILLNFLIEKFIFCLVSILCHELQRVVSSAT